MEHIDPRPILRLLAGECRPYAAKIGIGLALDFIAGTAPVGLAPTLQYLHDVVLTHPTASLAPLAKVVFALLAITLVGNAASYGAGYLSVLRTQQIIASLRVRCFERIVRLPIADFDRWRSGDIVTRLTSDLELAGRVAGVSLPRVVQSAVTVIGAFIYMFVTDWQLALIIVGGCSLLYLVITKRNARISASAAQLRDRGASLADQMLGALGFFRVVKAFRRESYEARQFASANRMAFDASLHLTRLLELQRAGGATWVALVLMFIVLLSTREVLIGRLDSGEVLRFWTLVAVAINPLTAMGNLLSDITQGLVSAARAFSILDLPEEPDTGVIAHVPSGGIRFEAVSFAYETGTGFAVEDLSLEIAEGTTLAIVGPSGAGKTTLTALLLRLYSPCAGRITIGGVDIADLLLGALREAVGIVPQDIALLPDTIAANIRYGRLAATAEDVEQAAQMAQADGFIRRLPRGYNTVVGRGGQTISQGERQRIAIARVILRNPPIVIFDEATNALDAESESLVGRALDEVLAYKTGLIIGHRLASIRRCTQIAYLQGGRLVEMGSHDELLARDGRYARLWETQLG